MFYFLMYAPLILLSIIAKVLYNNYKQALSIIHECDIADMQVFEAWLTEEKHICNNLVMSHWRKHSRWSTGSSWWNWLQASMYYNLDDLRWVYRYISVGKNLTLHEMPGSCSQVKTIPQWMPTLKGEKKLSVGILLKIMRKTWNVCKMSKGGSTSVFTGSLGMQSGSMPDSV